MPLFQTGEIGLVGGGHFEELAAAVEKSMGAS